MATPQENQASALERAASLRLKASEAASQGKTALMELYQKQAETWDASASRYQTIIDAKQRIAKAKENIAAIQEKLTQQTTSTQDVTSGRNKGYYAEVTSRPSSICPSGHERVQIEYMDGVQTKVTSLGCMGGSRQEIAEPDVPVQSSASLTPTPLTPSLINAPVITTPTIIPVKTAPIDTVLFNEDDVPIQVMQDLIFENIGGQELISIARNDTINGQNIIYQPIKNLTAIQQEYNPNNVVALQDTSNKYFQNFSIKIENKVPTDPTGPNGEHVYIDIETGSLIVEAVNLASDEQIEVEITTSGTIYEAEL